MVDITIDLVSEQTQPKTTQIKKMKRHKKEPKQTRPHFDDSSKRSFVYFLVSSDPRVTFCCYIGATMKLDTRLRRHNGELTNGAKRTHNAVARGHTWSRVCHVSGFPTWRTALQFESRWQRMTAAIRRKTIRQTAVRTCTPILWGMQALEALLAFDRASAASFLYTEWESRGGSAPCVHFDPESNYQSVCGAYSLPLALALVGSHAPVVSNITPLNAVHEDEANHEDEDTPI